MNANIRISAAPLTAEELAEVLKVGTELIEFGVVVEKPGERYGAYILRVMATFESGYEMVWSLDPESHAITVFRPKSDMKGFFAHHTFALPELPNFTCLTTDFFRMMGFTNTPSA